MKSKLFLPAFCLALLCLHCHGQEQKYYLTEAEYTQIVRNMMTAQKSLLECQSELSGAKADLQTLREQLTAQSESLRKSKEELVFKAFLAGLGCFGAGMCAGAALVYAR